MCLVVATDEHFNDTGSYKFPKRDWHQHWFNYPAEIDLAISEAVRASHDSDLYYCPNLMHARRRAADAAVARRDVTVDYDGELTGKMIQKVEDIDGWALESGRPGHAHIHVPLAESVNAKQHTILCKALGNYLGPEADAKFASTPGSAPAPTTAFALTTPTQLLSWQEELRCASSTKLRACSARQITPHSSFR